MGAWDYTKLSEFADHSDWCDIPFGPYLVIDPDDPDALAFQCRLKRGHDGGHNCPAARDAGYVDPSADFVDPTMIEKFLGEK